MEYREREDGQLSDDERTNLDEVESMIRTRMIMKGITPKTKPFKELVAEREQELPDPQPIVVRKEQRQSIRFVIACCSVVILQYVLLYSGELW